MAAAGGLGSAAGHSVTPAQCLTPLQPRSHAPLRAAPEQLAARLTAAEDGTARMRRTPGRGAARRPVRDFGWAAMGPQRHSVTAQLGSARNNNRWQVRHAASPPGYAGMTLQLGCTATTPDQGGSDAHKPVTRSVRRPCRHRTYTQPATEHTATVHRSAAVTRHPIPPTKPPLEPHRLPVTVHRLPPTVIAGRGVPTPRDRP